MNIAITALGSAAALLSTISFAPQAWKIIQTGNTKDISAGMYAVTVGAFFLWTIYGVVLGQWPLVASNTLCFFLSGFILVMTLLPQNKKNKVVRKIKANAGN